MPSFETGDVVRVPFPYTNRETTQHRPALVISDGAIGSGMFLWVLMITSESNRPWPGDVPLGDSYAAAGLPAPSRIRTLKMATIESATAEPIGKLGAAMLTEVQSQVLNLLGLKRF
jgi:mRNA interferase MazF